MTCPYCDSAAEKATGQTVYPHRKDLWSRKFWLCKPCRAWVGCHENSDWKAFGRLATKELRQLKMKAHAAFDPLWKSGEMSRPAAYMWLAKRMNMPVKRCHIGWFSEDQCRKVIQIMEEV